MRLTVVPAARAALAAGTFWKRVWAWLRWTCVTALSLWIAAAATD